jgi:hypothetical protein
MRKLQCRKIIDMQNQANRTPQKVNNHMKDNVVDEISNIELKERRQE